MTRIASLTDALCAKLEASILSGELPPGTRLPPQKDIAEREAVSRTVVREAVARLAARGFAEARQGSGVFVTEGAHYRAFQVTRDEMGDIADVIRLLEMRLAVEAEMASLAAIRRDASDIVAMQDALADMQRLSHDPAASALADMRFHMSIARATRNDYFPRFIEFLGERLVPPRSVYLRASSEADHRAYVERVQMEHVTIVDAIAGLDPDSARAAARHHMQGSLSRHSALAANSSYENS